MIVPMKRLTLLCVASAKEAALARLASMGVLHIETKKTDGTGTTAARAGADASARALSVVNAAVSAKGKPLSLRTSNSRGAGSLPLADKINSLADEYVSTQESLRALENQIAKYEPFGDFDPAAAQRLTTEAGITVALYKAPKKAAYPKAAYRAVLSESSDAVYGVAVNAADFGGGSAIPSPPCSLPAMRAEQAAHSAKLADIASISEIKNAIDKNAITLLSSAIVATT